MRCPKCNSELNPLSERCPNCGTSAKLAKPDGDTMTRVRKHISTVCGEKEEKTDDVLYTSFSPVMKFDKPAEKQTSDDEVSGENPADNFDQHEFIPVDISSFIDERGESLEPMEGETPEDARHRVISRQIRRMVSDKQDDLLAEYYFDDGISDLERYQLEKSYEELEKSEKNDNEQETSLNGENLENEAPQEISEEAKRLSQFPEESGIDKILTKIGEKSDRLVLNLKKIKKLIHCHLKKLYDKLDSKTEPFLNKLLDKFYYIKFKGLKRKSEDRPEEKRKLRKIIWGVCGAMLVAAMCVVIFIMSLFTDGITGQWIVSYDTDNNANIIMEFTAGGKAMISVKSDDGWHVHKQGSYKTQRKNGHDMLTITYEDGTVSRLYYEIDGKTGTFTNVETNVDAVYDLK